MAELLDDDECRDRDEDAGRCAGAEEAGAQDQHGDEAAQQTRAHRRADLSRGWHDGLLQEEEVDDGRAEDEACEEHCRFEETVTWVGEK